MGNSCISAHKAPATAMMPETEKILMPSLVKEKTDAMNIGNITVANGELKPLSARFQDSGSRDEGFFDSQPWLESDCEDDYYSVKGDFTPSRGSTPVHHHFSTLGNLLVTKSISVEELPSPPDRKKRLSDLFKESLREVNYEAAVDNQTEATAKVAPEPINPVHKPISRNGTPSLSRVDSKSSAERTPSRMPRAEDKLLKSTQCCLPGLLSSSGKEKRMSPAQNSG